MAILINLNDARKKLNELEGSAEYNKGVTDAFNALFDLPTVDAEPVKHGRWIEEGLVDGNQNRYCRCSECGKGDTQAISQRVPYCWWCGAKMDEVEHG